MPPEQYSAKSEQYVVYLHPSKFPYRFRLSKDANVEELEDLIRAHRVYGKHTENKDFFLLKYAKIQSREDRSHSVSEWLASQSIQRDRMEPAEKIAQYFPQGPDCGQSSTIDIVAVLESPPGPAIPGVFVRRQQLVEAIYTKARERVSSTPFVLVRGTPASGKTTLKKLLHRYIVQHDPSACVQPTSSWPTEANSSALSLGQRFERASANSGWSSIAWTSIRDRTTWLLMDEFQDAYWDREFWLWLKDTENTVYVVLFAVYGSDHATYHLPQHGTLPDMHPQCRVGLRPTDDMEHGLYFTREEYDEYIRSQPDIPQLHADLQQWMYDITNGHIGAMEAIKGLIIDLSKSEENRRSTVDLDGFFEYYKDPKHLIDKIMNTAFSRGLPKPTHLNVFDAPALHYLRKLLRVGVMPFEIDGPDHAAGLLVKRFGWATIDDQQMVQFTSPLHRLWASVRLDPQLLDVTFATMNLLQFVLSVIGKFTLSAIKSRPAPSSEFQWQHEFYRAACTLTGGRGFWLSPEFGTDPYAGRKGRFDFYIDEKKWGIEILQDGDMIPEHLNRFSDPGAYHQWVKDGTIVDYVVLDFCTQSATEKYPGADKFYRVVFEQDHSGFEIVDCECRVVAGGVVLETVSS